MSWLSVRVGSQFRRAPRPTHQPTHPLLCSSLTPPSPPPTHTRNALAQKKESADYGMDEVMVALVDRCFTAQVRMHRAAPRACAPGGEGRGAEPAVPPRMHTHTHARTHTLTHTPCPPPSLLTPLCPPARLTSTATRCALTSRPPSGRATPPPRWAPGRGCMRRGLSCSLAEARGAGRAPRAACG